MWPPRRLTHSVTKRRRNGIALTTPWSGSISRKRFTISKNRGDTDRAALEVLSVRARRAAAASIARCLGFVGTHDQFARLLRRRNTEHQRFARPRGSDERCSNLSRSERQRCPTARSRKPRQFYGSVELDMVRPVKAFDAVLNAIVMELQRTQGAKVKLTLEIEAVADEGFSDNDVSVVRDNARQLKFKPESTGFED